MRFSACFLTLILLAAFPLQGADDSPTPAQILSGTWGTGDSQLGIHFTETDILPGVPFMGPGGFSVDEKGAVWISDGINQKVKRWSEGAVTVFPIEAKKLGDIAVYKGLVYLCTLEPEGVLVINPATGAKEKFHAVPFKSPERLWVSDPDHIAVSDGSAVLWTIVKGAVAKHPAQALEPVGNHLTLFGTVYNLEDDNRKIIRAGWTADRGEPDLFTLFRTPGQKIVFSRLIGMLDGLPTLLVMLASDEDHYFLHTFGANGAVAERIMIPVYPGLSLPSSVIIGGDQNLYSFRADAKGFSLFMQKLR